MSQRATVIQIRSALARSQLAPLYRAAKRGVERIILAGNQVECPLCGSTFRRFLPLTYPVRRENARCLTCDSRERHRMMWLFLRDELKISEFEGVLVHVAPEPALASRLAATRGVHYFSTDVEPRPHGSVRKVQFIGDLTKLPMASGRAGGVICSHVLNYVKDDRQAFREMRRICSAAAWAIIQCPVDWSREVTFEDCSVTDPGQQLRLFNLEGHFRIYGRDYVARLAEAGFDVEVRWYGRELGQEKTRRFALPGDEPIFFCRAN